MNRKTLNRLDKGYLISFLGIYALLTVGILLVGYFMYRGQERRVRLDIEHQLTAVAELKTHELVRWREERYRDGVVFYNNPAFTTLFNSYLQKPNDADIHKQLMGWLTKHMDQYHYNQIRLMDVRGTTILSVPEDLGPASSGEIQTFAEILSTGEPSLSDFYQSINNQHIYLAMRVPIIDLEQGKTPIGLLSLRIDPEKFLYPFILKWPTLSTTAETLLVRREGSDVVYLNDLRFYKNAALNLRIPLNRTDYLVVQAVLGKTGIVEGTDYRKKAGIADVRSVPGSPWFLVTRIDTKEAYAQATEKLWLFVSLIVALLVSVGFALALVWRHQEAAFYLEKARIAETLRVVNLELRQKTAEMEVANRELEAFNYTLSHDLRSYLSCILLASETLLETEAKRLTEQGKHLLSSSLASCQSMEDLIATMLNLACLSRQGLQRAEVDLSGLARKIGCELSLAEPDRIIHFNITPELRVTGDAQMLRVVLVNLFGNACKYTKGKAEADISLTASLEGSRMVFAVTDNGTGFDMAEADDLFRPFKRLSNALGFSGFGVGLSTVQRIIQRHGGEIWAKAVPNEGATFYFTIPEQTV